MATKPKAPPVRLVRAIDRVRAVLAALQQRAVPANIAVLELAQGAWLAQALYAAVKLRIPDALATGPLSAGQVAQRVNTDPDSTYRLMRALASHSVLRLHRDGRFALTRIGHALRAEQPGTMAAMVELIGSPEHREHWSNLTHSVRTGETAVRHLRGMAPFEYFEANAELGAIFNEAMTSSSAMVIETVLPAYDFTDRRLIVDVGGGHGALLAAVLAQAPDSHGILFDLPSVIATAGPLLDAAGVRSRATLTGGSFFDSVPADGDTYLLKTIIHDWGDEQAVEILRTVRTAIAADGTVLLLEMVLPDGAPPHPGLVLDLEMLVSAGGRERTAEEYSKLLSQAGFQMTRVIPTASPVSIVEAVPA